MGFAVDDGAVQLWTPNSGRVMAHTHALMEPRKMVAHNASFELAIWNHVCVPKYGWRPLDASEVTCTMAMSYAMACPGALADAAPALGMTMQKDAVGHRVMMQLSQPRKVTEKACLFCENGCSECWGTGNLYEWYTPENSPEKFEKLYSYCTQDIEVERALFKRLMRLSDSEYRLWLLDRKINDRGVQIDLQAVHAAIAIVEAEKKRFNVEMRVVTGGAVATATATGQLTDWLKLKGHPVEGVAKSDVADLLKTDIAQEVRAALLIRQEASKSSTAKLKAMVNGVCADGRIRGLFQYHGAGATGRFAGRRIQPQNFPRSQIPQTDIEGVFDVLSRVS